MKIWIPTFNSRMRKESVARLSVEKMYVIEGRQVRRKNESEGTERVKYDNYPNNNAWFST